MNVLVIDLGTGNIRSLSSTLTYLGATHVVTADPAALRTATHVILPGVGAYDAAMEAVERLSLARPLQEYAVERSMPLLGVCLGMQILCEGSEEGRRHGLGLMPGRCLRLASNGEAHHKVPHVGFSAIHGYRDAGIFQGLGPNAHFYFTHSYALASLDGDSNVAVCDHARPFVAGFQSGMLCGVQFHPEKSQSTGLRLLSNFFELA